MSISTSIQLTSVFRWKEKLIQFLDFFFFQQLPYNFCSVHVLQPVNFPSRKDCLSR